MLENKIKKILLVCGNSILKLQINTFFETLEHRTGIQVIRFSDFTPNPKYESVEAGVKLFNNSGCDAIVAVGGGSAMDVAKCIKLFANMNHDTNYLQQTITENAITFIAVPTTAGTGSEATQFAVIYYNGEKVSVSDGSCIPHMVLFDASSLKTLPLYQKKATMLDALCHAIESYWSVGATEESRKYAADAIIQIKKYKDLYLSNEDAGNEGMLMAANMAGRAINITKTTAGHAMCYKLTTLYGISHGHAAALCVNKLYPNMINNIDKCIDERGSEYLSNMLNELSMLISEREFFDLISELDLESPVASTEDFDILKKSVNVERLKNHPVLLDEKDIDTLYHAICDTKGA